MSIVKKISDLCLIRSIDILCYIILFCVIIYNNAIFANNASYITLSNQIARSKESKLIGNNIANKETIGYQEDNSLFRTLKTHNGKQTDSFAYADSMYRDDSLGDITMTNRNLDLAIHGTGFFKVLTPRGERYTLNGSMFLSNDYTLVNSSGYPFLSSNNQPINLPPDVKVIDIGQDGLIYADKQQIDFIGVFEILNPNNLQKEGNSLYKGNIRDNITDDPKLVVGGLRRSNVNVANIMSKMMEVEHSVSATNNLMMKMNELERSTISKLSR